MSKDIGGILLWEMGRKTERYNLGFYSTPFILEE